MNNYQFLGQNVGQNGQYRRLFQYQFFKVSGIKLDDLYTKRNVNLLSVERSKQKGN